MLGMSDDKKMPKVGRRDSLKLATAVTALGAGLGIVLDGNDAAAETVKMKTTEIGNFTVKLYKYSPDGQAALIETVDIGALALKMQKGGSYSLKMYNHKDSPVMLTEQLVAIEPAKLAPIAAPVQAPVAPIQAPVIKR
jgi:hypothetical protein